MNYLISVPNKTPLCGIAHCLFLTQYLYTGYPVVAPTIRSQMTTIDININNTLIHECFFFFLEKKPPHPLLYNHVMFRNLFQPWLFYNTQLSKIINTDYWALIPINADRARDKGFIMNQFLKDQKHYKYRKTLKIINFIS